MTTLRPILLTIFILVPNISSAQWHGPAISDSLSVQGYLTDSSGVAVDGPTDMTIKLYKRTQEVWSQTQSGVPVSSGVFNLILGGPGTASLDTVAFSEPIELGITVGGEELTPRTPLVPSAYALGMRGMYAVAAESGGNRSINLIGGASNNVVGSGVIGAAIGGGGGFYDGIEIPDSVLSHFGTIGGGGSNTAAGLFSTVGGGQSNKARRSFATISGGSKNQANLNFSTVGGGVINIAAAALSTVAGGKENVTSGHASAIAGGESNLATGTWSTIAGGWENKAGRGGSTVGGGYQNTSSGTSSTVPGGRSNAAQGDYSLAAGYYAKALHDGTFVWNDGTGGEPDSLFTTAANQFLVRATGGVGIGTNAPVESLHITEASGSSGVFLGGGGTIGPHGIVFDDDTKNEGVSLFYRTGPNQLVLERGSAGTLADSADVFVYDRDDDSFRFNGGNVVLSRAEQAASHQLELRNVGNITNANYDGIRFSQGSTGSITLGLIKVLYHNTGKTDMSLSLRHESDLLYLDDPTLSAGDGRVGIGTTTPSERLEVNGNVLANNVVVPSDLRLKRDIQPLSSPLKTIARLNGVSYKWRTDEFPDRSFENGRHIGFIAQDAEDVVPEAVSLGADGTYSMRYQEIIPILVEAIKELSTKVESQSEMISELQAAITN